MQSDSHGKQITIMLGTAILLNLLSGCKGNKSELSEEYKFNDIANEVRCIDEMPDWAGKQFDLITWYCHGTYAPEKGKTAKQDLFRDELKRVTGISINEEKSFDNGGESGDVKISELIAKNDFPDIAFDLQLNLQARLEKAGKIYNLTDYIPKYATNLMRVINSDEQLRNAFEDLMVDKKLFFFPKFTSGVYQFIDPDNAEEMYNSVEGPKESMECIWVRDDILKKIHPECKTQAEIIDQYIEKGEFSADEICDFTISSLSEFHDFLQDINDLQLIENGNKVWPFYTHNGTDNWSLLSVMNCLVGARNVDYFSYFDMQQKKIMPTMKQPWFKDLMKFYNNLVREGLASREAFTDNREEFETKKNNGEYAIIYGIEKPPSDAVLRKNGKAFSYRKVLIDIPEDYHRFGDAHIPSEIFGGLRITIFKSDRIQEEDLEQIIRFLDFFYSDAGMKYCFYGPEKSGLYTETDDGLLLYTDKKMEEDMIDTGNSQAWADYGFTCWPSLENFTTGANIYNPRIMYSRLGKRRASMYTTEWNSAKIRKNTEPSILKMGWAIWHWTQYIEGVQRFWDSRQSTETALQLVFTAKNDMEFEQLYYDMIDIVERNGLTAETMEEWNMKFKEFNKDYIYGFLNWKPENSKIGGIQ